MTTHEWTVEIDSIGRVTRADVEGLGDLSGQLHGVDVRATPGEPPMLVLYPQAGVSIEGVSVVEQVPGRSIRDEVLGWLDSLDAADLEAKALASVGGFGGADTTGDAFLAALRQMARTLP